ncbi:phage tail assembly chaperone [Pseudomonas sp. TWR2-1-1]|uniref:phage tail assembly chaperone n=1 Tax=Pseudomonas sp. TWR2-1-1 TaxID=2804610 RepID=UPI003CF522F3
MSKNKVYHRQGFVIGVGDLGEIPGAQHVEVEDCTKIIEALNSGRCVIYLDGEFKIQESRAAQWLFIRQSRDMLLSESDVEIMKIRDSEVISGVVSQQHQELAGYRQALRDITLQSDPFNIKWPVWSQI